MKKIAKLKGAKTLSKKEQVLVVGGSRVERCLPGFYPAAVCESNSDCYNGKHCDVCTGQCVQ